MLDYTECYMSYLDNVFRQHGPIMYEKSPRSIKCWQRVLGTLEKYRRHPVVDDTLIIGNQEVTINFTRGLDRYIMDHIYELTSINRNICGNWNTVKDALEKYVFVLQKR